MADRSEIDEVKSRIDFVSVVEQYVSLRKVGKNFKGLCPFHGEKTPSFHVSPEIGFWKCFGCQESGDVFKFIEKIENLSFAEALERLAIRAGVTLSRRSPQGGVDSSTLETGEKERIYRINSLALRHFRNALRKSAHAMAYLRQRGIAPVTEEAFGLGYAPDEWEGLTGVMIEQGVSLTDAERAGLVTRRDRGGFIDKMRGRLVFPIFDNQDRPIAFGGRLIDAGDRPGQPKYWNSPETPVFSKGKTLYGLSKARHAIKTDGRAIVVEGYTDVISAHQAGFENVVATLGTSLTSEHVSVLKRHAATVLLAFDADSAGLKAAMRAEEIFAAQDVAVRVLELPDGEDPDSLLRKGQAAVFAKAIAEAQPIVEYKLRRLTREAGSTAPVDHVAFFKKAIPLLAMVESVIERDRYVGIVAPLHPLYHREPSLAADQVRHEVSAQISAHAAAQGRPAARPAARVFHAPVRDGVEKAERHLLRALLSGIDELVGPVLHGGSPQDFLSPSARRLAASIFAHAERGGSLETDRILLSINDDVIADAARTLLLEDLEPLTPQSIQQELAHLRLSARRRELALLKSAIDGGEVDSTVLRRYIGINAELKGTNRHDS